jgi:ribose/xylose/arabinose/galactoside ABC-type transport system permease subunit
VSTPDTAVGSVWRARLRRVPWQQLTPLAGLLLLLIIGSLIHPAFLTSTNLFNVLTRSAFIGIIAVGGTFVIIGGGIDLSVGSMAAFLSGAMILLMNALHGGTLAPIGVVLIGVGVVLGSGLVAGAANGLAITRGRIEPFIVTLGTLGIFRSLVTYLADGGTISLNFALRGSTGPSSTAPSWGSPSPSGRSPSSPSWGRSCCTARASAATCARSAPTRRSRATPRSASPASERSPT